MNHRPGILLDTSALIALVNLYDPDCNAVMTYVSRAISENVEVHLSSLTIAEFCVRQEFETIDQRTFIISPFDVPESVLAGQYDALLKRETGDDRVAMKIDVMLIAHAQKLGLAGILTLDANSLAKYCRRLAAQGKTDVQPILASEPFNGEIFEKMHT